MANDWLGLITGRLHSAGDVTVLPQTALSFAYSQKPNPTPITSTRKGPQLPSRVLHCSFGKATQEAFFFPLLVTTREVRSVGRNKNTHAALSTASASAACAAHFDGVTWKPGGVGETIYSSHESVSMADLMLQKFVWLNLSTPVIWKTFNIACHFRNGPLKSWKWENNKSQSLAGEYSRENKVSRLKGCFISSPYRRFGEQGQFFFSFSDWKSQSNLNTGQH